MKEIKACFFDFDGTLRDFETGKVPESTLKAFEIMKEKASKRGANAIIALKIAYNNLGGTMGNTILITAYGTAVKYVEK